MERKTVSQGVSKRIRERDGNRCIKCGLNRSLEIHHKIPVYLGGDDSDENLVTLCSFCHRYAPNRLEKWDNYLKEKLPYHIALSRDFVKIFKSNKFTDVMVDRFFNDLWGCFKTDDVEMFSRFLMEWLPLINKDGKKGIKVKSCLQAYLFDFSPPVETRM